MASRKLSREETDFIREYIQEGAERGETEREIKARRAEVAEMLGCLLRQVASASAWKDEGGDKLVCAPQKYKEIRGSVLNPNDEKEAVEDGIEITKTATVEILDEENSKEYQGAEPPKITGANFEYDNPEKNEWRDWVLSNLCKRIPLDERHQKRILCLGGARNHEPRAYIENGFLPRNILSVEKDKSAWNEFEASAAGLGIRTFTGSIGELRSSERFDIVSLDYTGPLGGDKFNDIQSILLTEKAFVILNCEQKREKLETRAVANEHQHQKEAVFQKDGGGALIDNFKKYMLPPETQLKEIDLEPLTYEEWETARKQLMTFFISSFGEQRNDVRLPIFPRLEELLLMRGHESNVFWNAFSENFVKALHKRNKVKPPKIAETIPIALLNLYKRFQIEAPFIKEVEFYKYKSERGKSPFQTIFAEMHTPSLFYRENRKIIHSFGSVLDTFLELGDEGRLWVGEMTPAFSLLGSARHLAYELDGKILRAVNLDKLSEVHTALREIEGNSTELAMLSADSINKEEFDQIQMAMFQQYGQTVQSKQKKNLTRKILKRRKRT